MTKNNIIQGSLKEMIEYQAESVISKTLIKNEGGTVTLFAFAEGASISEHTASHEAMVQVLDGTIEFVISGEPYKVSQGKMVIMPADEPHGLRALENSKMLLTMIE